MDHVLSRPVWQPDRSQRVYLTRHRVQHMMNYTFLSATILLVLITDPVGNIPILVLSR